jgi:hypothetical protein
VSHPLDRYFIVPDGVYAFLNTLNISPEFSPDRLAMQPDDIAWIFTKPETSTVGGLHSAIKDWYRANGWTVT